MSSTNDDQTPLKEDEREKVERESSSTPENPPDHDQDRKTDEKAANSDRESEKEHVAEDDDGFRTPTSSDQRIPAITQCPPAPRKPRLTAATRKRKASPPPGASRSLQLEASTAEVESIFQPVSDDQDETENQKRKRARTDDRKD